MRHTVSARTPLKGDSMSNPLRSLALGSVVLMLVVTGACSSASDGGSDAAGAPGDLTSLPKISVDKALADELPADVASAGSLAVATSAALPPMTYVDDDNSTIVGFDADMAKAIAATLGLKADIQNVGFDTIIPGLQSGRYDIALGSIGVTLERQKVVDFVSYYNGGQGFLASADSDFRVSTIEDLCGRKVAVQTGSAQQSILEDEAGTCVTAGKKPWSLQTFPGTNEAVLAISGNRADVFYASISVVGYTADQNDAFRVAGLYKRALVGAPLPKGSPLTPVVQKAVQHLIDDGTYAKLLDKWGLADNALTEATINGAVS
jgi:polar amino acid transport system substrate-binding protein